MKRLIFCSILALSLAFAALLNAGEKVKVAVTTTMIADLAREIGGDHVTVQALMGPGVDPHLYKATASDVARLQQAQVIFYNGLLLEGKIQELFDKMSKRKKVFAVTGGIPKDKLLKPEDMEGHDDPHVWFDVTLWQECAAVVVMGLSETDPANKSFYEKRGSEFRDELGRLHQWVLNKVAELPKEKRILVTSHDAYSYFGKAYGFQVVGLQGISTVTEAGTADMARMVDFIKQQKVKAIFVESSVPHNTIERISKDAGVKVGGEIFSDAMGTPGQMENGYDVGTYEGMIKHNVNTVVNALK